jgi:hypothetical protein
MDALNWPLAPVDTGGFSSYPVSTAWMVSAWTPRATLKRTNALNIVETFSEFFILTSYRKVDIHRLNLSPGMRDINWANLLQLLIELIAS